VHGFDSLIHLHTPQLRLPGTISAKTELNSCRHHAKQHRDSSVQASIPPFPQSMVYTTVGECLTVPECSWDQPPLEETGPKAGASFQGGNDVP
jgi:hypothetical protein